MHRTPAVFVLTALVATLVGGCGGPLKPADGEAGGSRRSAAAFVPASAGVVGYGTTVRGALEVARAAVLPVLAAAEVSEGQLHAELQKRFGFDPLAVEDLDGLGVEIDQDVAIDVSPRGLNLIVGVRDPSRTNELMQLGGPADKVVVGGATYYTRPAGELRLSWVTLERHLVLYVGIDDSAAFATRARAAAESGPSWADSGRAETLEVLATATAEPPPVVASLNLGSLLWAELAPCLTRAFGGSPILGLGARQEEGVVIATAAARLDPGLAASLADRRRAIAWPGMADLFSEAPIALFVSVLGERVAIPDVCRGVADTILPFAPAVETVVAAVFEADMVSGKGKAAVQVHAPSMKFASDMIADLGIPDFMLRSSVYSGRKARTLRFPGVPEVVFYIGASDAVVAVGSGMAQRAFAAKEGPEAPTRGLFDLRLAIDPASPTARFARDLIRDAAGDELADFVALLSAAFARLEISADVRDAEASRPVGAAEIRLTPRR